MLPAAACRSACCAPGPPSGGLPACESLADSVGRPDEVADRSVRRVPPPSPHHVGREKVILDLNGGVLETERLRVVVVVVLLTRAHASDVEATPCSGIMHCSTSSPMTTVTNGDTSNWDACLSPLAASPLLIGSSNTECFSGSIQIGKAVRNFGRGSTPFGVILAAKPTSPVVQDALQRLAKTRRSGARERNLALVPSKTSFSSRAKILRMISHRAAGSSACRRARRASLRPPAVDAPVPR